jgi:hypothetical protein
MIMPLPVYRGLHSSNIHPNLSRFLHRNHPVYHTGIKAESGRVYFAVFQGTSNGGQQSANLRSRVNRLSDLPYHGTIWRFDGLLLKKWRPLCQIPWKTAK